MVTRTEYAAARAFQNARFVKIVHAAAVVIAARLQDTDLLGGVQVSLYATATAKGMLAVACIKAARCRPYSSVVAASLLSASATVGSIGRNIATLKKSASAFLPKRVPVGTYGISHVDPRFLIFSPPWSLFPTAFAAIRQVVPVFLRNTAAWRCARHRCPPRISSLQCRTASSRNVPAGSESR